MQTKTNILSRGILKSGYIFGATLLNALGEYARPGLYLSNNVHMVFLSSSHSPPWSKALSLTRKEPPSLSVLRGLLIPGDLRHKVREKCMPRRGNMLHKLCLLVRGVSHSQKATQYPRAPRRGRLRLGCSAYARWSQLCTERAPATTTTTRPRYNHPSLAYQKRGLRNSQADTQPAKRSRGRIPDT